ncbi:MAG: DUF6797 domain-containing protein [Pirellula sp.]
MLHSTMFRTILWLLVTLLVATSAERLVSSEPLSRAKNLEQLLKEAPIDALIEHTLARGNARRGAILFHKSTAACSKCHASGENPSSLGPDLSRIDKKHSGPANSNVSHAYLINAILYPSKDVLAGYETQVVQTNDGAVVSGILKSESANNLTLLTPSDLARPVELNLADIDVRKTSKTSLMPEGLVASFRELSEFLDVAAYVFEIAMGGPSRAQELQPSTEELAIKEDWVRLDHAGIIEKLKSKEFEAGKAIYEGYCIDCHGPDGNKATLPTARAFGSQPMKFGADPYRMFMTLTRGSGLMGPMSHLTPRERYEVVHYVRERFMKGKNPEYVTADRKYLDSLPKGTDDGKSLPVIERDLGPALASQLERRFRNVLSVRLGDYTLAYDLHTMNQAELWSDGFLDLSDTQHQRDRGEGVPKRVGSTVVGLQGWEWGHDGTFDYPRTGPGILPRGPLPAKWMRYKGYHLHGSHVIMSYQIDGRDVLELALPPEKIGPTTTLQRRLEIGPGNALILAVAKAEPSLLRDFKVSKSELGGKSIRVDAGRSSNNTEFVSSSIQGDADTLEWHFDEQGRVILRIPASAATRSFDIIVESGPSMPEPVPEFDSSRRRLPRVKTAELRTLLNDGQTLWPDVHKTVGYLGLQQGAYALDTITIPNSTPSNTWFRTTALDFLSDGRMVVATHGGDMWVVSGVNDSLLQLQWKRFAAGLYEPMGVKVVNDQIYVICKDRIVRLHDRDGNGEADYYENFSDETDISFNFHAFNFDLQTDDVGNFYYAKGGNGSDMALPGAVIQVSADGLRQQAFSTGFRAPNGMGTLPGGLITCSDNQGHWMPASKISLLKRGGFYGWCQTYDGKDRWAPDGGRIDVKKVVPPSTFDQPIIWMPQDFDNSSGGQIWVDDARWGPLSGRLLHTSFGKGWLSYLMVQQVDDIHQAAIIKLPFDFRTGIMRGRINPRDGQLYVTGLQGWNGGGRIGLLDQGIQRLRYTGKPMAFVSDCRVESDGLRLNFSFELDIDSVMQPDAFDAKHWNYKWQASYGSDMYSPSTGKVGVDSLTLEKAQLNSDRRSIKLTFRELQPVDQLQLQMRLKSTSGEPFHEEVYWTIHRVPK